MADAGQPIRDVDSVDSGMCRVSCFQLMRGHLSLVAAIFRWRRPSFAGGGHLSLAAAIFRGWRPSFYELRGNFELLFSIFLIFK